MKKFITLMALVMSAHSFAQEVVVEFDQTEEMKCHAEIKAIGCATSTDGEDNACIEQNKAKLSPKCQSLHSERTSR